jgi:hypothetical protein
LPWQAKAVNELAGMKRSFIIGALIAATVAAGPARALGNEASPALVLLRHEPRVHFWILAAQHGHRDSVWTSATVNRLRMVAIELAMCRSGRKGGASGSMTFANGKFREQREGSKA